MERGLDPRRSNWLGITPLHRCAAAGNVELAAVCLEFGAEIDAVDTEYASTPLGWTARAGQGTMVEWLLQKGANPELPEDEPLAVPRAWAERRGHRDVLDKLR
jgi:ankyrin repeat protein